MIYQQYIKPWLELPIVAVILVGSLFLLPVIVLGYILSMEYPMLFRQTRLGKNEKPFTIYKFRTLHGTGSSAKPFLWGRILRFTSLDELPQCINIFRGEMSLIGPRPLPISYKPLFSTYERKRFKVLPGITGWTQVHDRHTVPWKKKFELDIYYVDHISLKLDAIIVVKTIGLLWSFKQDNSLMESQYKGV